jgi:uncharacterized membrane protein YqjE
VTIALTQLPGLAPIIVKHLGAYVELAMTDASQLMQSLMRRMLGALVALVGVVVSLMLGCTWLISVAWNTPWRDATIAALLVAFVMMAIGGTVTALRSWPIANAPFARLRSEWSGDQTLLDEMSLKGSNDPAVRSAQEVLQQSRLELRELFGSADETRSDTDFPRSTTLRLLFGGVGNLLNLASMSSLTYQLFKRHKSSRK